VDDIRPEPVVDWSDSYGAAHGRNLSNSLPSADAMEVIEPRGRRANTLKHTTPQTFTSRYFEKSTRRERFKINHWYKKKIIKTEKRGRETKSFKEALLNQSTHASAASSTNFTLGWEVKSTLFIA
jgi:hypothetical protein